MNYEKLRYKLNGPAYIYNLEAIRHSYRCLYKSLPENSIIFYSLKANPHPELVKELIELGCYAEICSIGELNILKDLDHDMKKTIYTGPGKSILEIRHAIDNGVKLFSIESWNDLTKVFEVSKELNIKVNGIIRINPELMIRGVGLNMTGVPSQFGIDENLITSIPNIVSMEDHLVIKGFHIYTGTNISDEELLIENFKNCVITSKRIAEKLNLKLDFLNLGGGFGHPFAQEGNLLDFSKVKIELEKFLDEEFRHWREGIPQLAFESGRYLVASCGKLVTRVEDIKISKDKIFYILESGINHLGGMSGLNRVPKVSMEFLSAKGNMEDKDIKNVNVTGPLCTPLDTLSRNVPLPKANIGDTLVIHNVGAYGLYASLIAFLSREIPIEVVVDEDKIKSITQLKLQRVTKGGFEID